MKTIARQWDRAQGKREKEWIWMFQERLGMLARDKRVKGAHWRVLAFVMSSVTFRQDMAVKHRDIVAALGMHAADVSRHLRDLETFGVLARVETHAYPPTYRLNALYAYKGRGERLPGRREHQRKARLHD